MSDSPELPLGPLADPESPHRVRPYRKSDEPYLLVSWVAGAVRSPTYSGLERQLAFALLRPHVLSLLSRPTVRVSIVCPSDMEEPIEAFCVSEGPVLYHIHVKATFRGQGIMTDLLRLHGFEPGSRIIAATDTTDLRGVKARGRYDIRLRPDLLLIEETK